MRVLLDTDVVLDLLLDREPFAADAVAIWQAGEKHQVDLYVSAITPINVFYVARKLKGEETAKLLVASLLATCRICTVDQSLLLAALASTIRDFEDAVQAVAASVQQLDAIVTRNLRDYTDSPVPVLSPSDLLHNIR